MSIYEIIKALQAAKGSIAKQTILTANKDNELFRDYMKAVYDPALCFYQTKLPAPYSMPKYNIEFSSQHIRFVRDVLAARNVTGYAAIEALAKTVAALNPEGKELMGMLIKRSIGGSVGETMVLKTWPGLFFIPSYMRCSGMSPKVKAEYAAMPYFFVQTKLDGSFGYLQRDKGVATLFTRAGSHYPSWLAEKLAADVFDGHVVMGEVLVYSDDKPLSRKVSNGLLNSVLQSGGGMAQDVRMVAWDMVTAREFKAGLCETPYKKRFKHLQGSIEWAATSISVVEHCAVTSLEQAFAVNHKAMLRGEEGTVWKNPEGTWRNSSSGTRDAVKVKIAFQAEYKVVGKYEGEGKAKGMLGGFNIESSDGLISNNVGSGFSDAQRKEFWNEDVEGWIVTLDANDVISREGSTTESLFLPIFIERRLDKTEADSRERVLEQLQSAKEGV